MTLISLAVDRDMPELGRMYQRLLSATAHSAIHGLARMLTPLSPNEGRPGEALAAVNIDPRKLAVSSPWPAGWLAVGAAGASAGMLPHKGSGLDHELGTRA
jgi:hypothetical protein